MAVFTKEVKDLASANTSTLGDEYFHLIQGEVSKKSNLKDHIPQPAFANVSVATAMTFSNSSITTIRTLGYTSPGDGGGAVYVNSGNTEPTHAGKFQSADGDWWEISESIWNARMFGAKMDGTTDDTTAINSLLAVVPEGKRIIFDGSSVVSDQITLEGLSKVHLDFIGGPILESNNLVSVFVANNCNDLQITGLKGEKNWEGGPSNNHTHNKLVFAKDCDKIRVQNLEARGLGAVRLDRCSEYFLFDLFGDTEGNVATYHVEAGDNQGWDYGIKIQGSSYGSCIKYRMLNYAQDGVKVQVSQIDDVTVGEKLHFVAGEIRGCINDDAMDLFNSGYEVIVDGLITENCQKALNIKTGGGTGRVGKVIVSNFHIIGGEYNTSNNILDFRQTGISIDVENVWVQNGTIENIAGHAILIGENAKNAHVMNVSIKDVAEVTGESQTGIAVSVSGAQEDCSLSNMVISNSEIYSIGVNGGNVPDMHNIKMYESGTYAINISTNTEIVARMTNLDAINSANNTGDTAFRFTGIVAAKHELVGASSSGFTTALDDRSTGRLVWDDNVSWSIKKGTTAERPVITSANQRRDGRQYFDTDLGKYIMSVGATWVNLDGSVL